MDLCVFSFDLFEEVFVLLGECLELLLCGGEVVCDVFSFVEVFFEGGYGVGALLY